MTAKTDIRKKRKSRLTYKEYERRNKFCDAFDSTSHTFADYLSLLITLCIEVNTPFSLKVFIMIRNKCWDDLVQLNVDPNLYDLETYRLNRIIQALIVKYPHWDVRLDPKVEAMKKFIASEISCHKLNLELFKNGTSKCMSSLQQDIFFVAKDIIRSILGDVPDIEDLTLSFGPGSNTSVKRRTTAFDKLGSTLDVSINCRKLASKYLANFPGWADLHFFKCNEQPPLDVLYKSILKVVPGDQLSFVPKTAKAHRSICVAPLINSVIQRAIGKLIRKRMKPVLDLKTLQVRHRILAKQASVTNSLATIDLSNASDSISACLVQQLLPHDWEDLMSQARVPNYVVDGRSFELHKYSAMGNGFTFELETLIFYALAKATSSVYKAKGPVSVYGDDIIVPSSIANELIQLLATVGFEVNEEKSFISGPFRESCGGDYYMGHDVRPFFLKDRLNYRTLFLLHNVFVRNCDNYLLPKTFRKIRTLIGKDWCNLFRGSSLIGDGHLLDVTIPDNSHFSIENKATYRDIPFTSYEHLKAWVLYRANSPEFDKLLPSFYTGVAIMKNSLVDTMTQKKYIIRWIKYNWSNRLDIKRY